MNCNDSRVIHERWAMALANGAKPFELQQYSDHWLNQMKLAKEDDILVVGVAGQERALAFAVIALH